MKKLLLGLIVLTFACCKIPTTFCQSQSQTKRSPEHTVDTIFTNRWSPRALSGESITDHELMSLFEAARWAPSSYNAQPWVFIYSPRTSSTWNTFLNLLVPFNQKWAKNAAVLVVVVSKKTFDSGEPSPTHSFDAGAACQNLALQGSLMGLVVHGMGGFDFDRAKTELNIPDDYTVEAMFAIGKPGNVKDLPQSMQKMETPSNRKPIAEFVSEGSFKK